MIKIYIYSVVVWFVLFILTGIVFKKKFKEAQIKIRKFTDWNEEEYGVLKTTILYLIESLIPVRRCLLFFGKLVVIFRTDVFIEFLKEKKEDDKEE